MSSSSNRDHTTPFLVQMFYRNGAFYRADEFASSSVLPQLSVYTWPDCTLHELALELASLKPSALPNPAIGTRVSFQLVCPDLRGTSAVVNSQPRFAVKDLGSIVIGHGGPGVEQSDGADLAGKTRGPKSSDRTLSSARFVVGDYISCAIFPPLSDGSVAPASLGRREPAGGSRDAQGSHRGAFMGPGSGFGRGGSRGGRGGRTDDSRGGFPMGDWSRGESLPDARPGRPRGQGRW